MKKLITILIITIPIIILMKYIVQELNYYLTANDDIDSPYFDEIDHAHLNEVSK